MINKANYSHAVMKSMLSVLPYGTVADISKQLNITHSTVANCCYGKQFIPEVVNEVERRFKAVKRQFAK